MPEKKYRPLADELRPTELDDVVGQNHILGKGGLLRRIIESGDIPNMIFYGPSGTGKTTVARIIAEKHEPHAAQAQRHDRGALRISARSSTSWTPCSRRTAFCCISTRSSTSIKSSSRALLEFIENGSITLIASTTENPYFYVYNAVLSAAATVFEFKADLGRATWSGAVRRAVRLLTREREGVAARLPRTSVVSHRGAGLRRRRAQGAQRGGASVHRRAAHRRAASCSRRTTPRADDAAERHALRPRGRRALRRCLRADEIAARLRSGRGAALSCAAARGRGPARRVPPHPLLGERGHRHGVPAGGELS